MCGMPAQMASWRDVYVLSQPLVEIDSEVVSTPMRFANIVRLNDEGEQDREHLTRYARSRANQFVWVKASASAG